MRRDRLLAVAVTGFIAAAFAGGGAGAAAPRKDACGLLTKAEVSTALKETVSSMKGGRDATGGIFCNWLGKNTGLFPKGISLVAATDNAKQRYNGFAQLLEKRTTVSGVGVAAVTDGNVILARSGRAVVQVGATYANSGIPLAAIKTLTKKALARA